MEKTMKLTKQMIISISSILLCSCTYTHLGKTTINYEDSSNYIDGNRTINNNITTLNINWAAGNIYVISNENQKSTIEIKEEITKGKDTTTGHWEIAGLISEKPFATYPNGFPKELIDKFNIYNYSELKELGHKLYIWVSCYELPEKRPGKKAESFDVSLSEQYYFPV